MTALESYPEYKDSGVEWLGAVPRQWGTTPLKRAARFVAGGTPDSNNQEFWTDEGGIPWVAIGDMSGRDFVTDTGRQLTRAGVQDKRLRVLSPSTVLFAMYASVGEASVLQVEATTNQAILGIQPVANKLDQKFLFYSLKAVQRWLGVLYRSNTQNNLNANQVGNLNIAAPPLDQQRAIACFLDHETAEVDAFIADQQGLIELLKERRAATIAQAVTKGLDPTVPMKDSGVEWLGDVPAGWAVSRIKHVGTTHIGLTYSPSDIVDAQQDGVLVLRSGNVQDGRLHYADSVYVNTNIPPSIRTREGDILICARNGSRALIGKSAVITQEAAGQTFGAFMTVLRSPANRFISWVLNSSIFQAQMGLFVTATINQLTNSTLNNFELPFPPVKEQHAIADYLDRETAEIDATIADAKEAIELSKERRAALISAAVTGKIDVRDHPAARGAA